MRRERARLRMKESLRLHSLFAVLELPLALSRFHSVVPSYPPVISYFLVEG